MTAAGCVSCDKQASAGPSFCFFGGKKIPRKPPTSSPATSVPRLQGGVFGETNYVIDQKLFALRDTFGIKDDSGIILAVVKREILSFGPKFLFETQHGARLGEVQGKILSVRPTFEVYDASERLVAVVKKKLFSLLGSQWWMEDSA